MRPQHVTNQSVKTPAKKALFINVCALNVKTPAKQFLHPRQTNSNKHLRHTQQQQTKHHLKHDGGLLKTNKKSNTKTTLCLIKKS